jgi:hypothetical protein
MAATKQRCAGRLMGRAATRQVFTLFAPSPGHQAANQVVKGTGGGEPTLLVAMVTGFIPSHGYFLRYVILGNVKRLMK